MIVHFVEGIPKSFSFSTSRGLPDASSWLFQVQSKRNFNCSTPGDVFLKFFDGSVLDDIIYQSNLYANQRQVKMQPISRQEMYGFLGINIVMGYHKLPSWTDYSKGDQDLSVPFVISSPKK